MNVPTICIHESYGNALNVTVSDKDGFIIEKRISSDVLDYVINPGAYLVYVILDMMKDNDAFPEDHVFVKTFKGLQECFIRERSSLYEKPVDKNKG